MASFSVTPHHLRGDAGLTPGPWSPLASGSGSGGVGGSPGGEGGGSSSPFRGHVPAPPAFTPAATSPSFTFGGGAPYTGGAPPLSPPKPNRSGFGGLGSSPGGGPSQTAGGAGGRFEAELRAHLGSSGFGAAAVPGTFGHLSSLPLPEYRARDGGDDGGGSGDSATRQPPWHTPLSYQAAAPFPYSSTADALRAKTDAFVRRMRAGDSAVDGAFGAATASAEAGLPGASSSSSPLRAATPARSSPPSPSTYSDALSPGSVAAIHRHTALLASPLESPSGKSPSKTSSSALAALSPGSRGLVGRGPRTMQVAIRDILLTGPKVRL